MIKTRRLKIYPCTNEQMESLIEGQTSMELKAAYTQMLNDCLSNPEQRVWYAIWNLELNDDSNVVIGNMSFRGLDKEGVLEIGYGMNAGYEGKGYMTEAVSAIVRWASTQDGVKKIEAEIEESNGASKRVLKKAGFVLNGKMGEEGPRFVWKG